MLKMSDLRQFNQLKRMAMCLALVTFISASAFAQDLGIPYQPRALGGEFARSGNPQCVAPWARPSREKQDGGYYVGGSKALRGDGRGANEGTWGSDYAPWYSRVSLKWNHGRRYQSGGGQYESERKNNPLRIGAPN
jgi:hypothetical protein